MGERYRTLVLAPKADPLTMPVDSPEERRARHLVLVLEAFEHMLQWGGQGISDVMIDDFMRRTHNALRGLAMAKAGGFIKGIYSRCVCEPDMPTCRPMLGGETGEAGGISIADYEGWGLTRLCFDDPAWRRS